MTTALKLTAGTHTALTGGETNKSSQAQVVGVPDKCQYLPLCVLPRLRHL